MSVSRAEPVSLAEAASPPSGRPSLPALLGECGMIGRSKPLRELGALLTKLADGEATVLVTGESGTGKELVARALHLQSRRAAGPFVAVNCAALPEALLESELFGHVKGAFTSASESKAGLFSVATGGTLFLDEIAELSPLMQAKLLRALQERCVRPVGSSEEIPVDVRLVAATNRDLLADVEAGRFRQDLYYRIAVVHVAVPPLRARGADVLLLSDHFLAATAERLGRPTPELTRAAASLLLQYGWPGNVRELQNCVEHAMAVATGATIDVGDLPASLQPAAAPAVVEQKDAGTLLRLSEVERRYIGHVLHVVGNNKTRAAAVLGIDRRTLHRKLKRGSDSAVGGR